MKPIFIVVAAFVALFFSACQTGSSHSSRLSNSRVHKGQIFDANDHAMEGLPGESLVGALYEGHVLPLWNGKTILIIWPPGHFYSSDPAPKH